MKKYILSALSVILSHSVFSQSNDEIIFKAMQDEMDRNMKELKLDKTEKPSYMSYALFDGGMLNITGVLGSVVKVYDSPMRLIGARVLLGDKNFTSEGDYANTYQSLAAGTRTDYGQLRREYWSASDAAYKTQSTNMATKRATRRQRVRTPEEAALPDLLEVEPATRIIEGPKVTMDRAKWEKNVGELSAIFLNYPTLYNSSVAVDINDFYYYIYTTEGTKLKVPMSLASVNVTAIVRSEDGAEYKDDLDIYSTTDATLPDMAALKARVDAFAKKLSDYAVAPVMDEFYSGPALFVDESVAEMFTRNLISPAGVLSARRPEFGRGSAGGGNTKRNLENRLGQRVIDTKITIKNTPSMKQYNGIDLLGYYEVDADGITPEELILIDTGVMRALLNGRVPTLKSPASTGSQRFGLYPRAITTRVAPGTLVVEVRDGKSRAELEAELIKMAKNDGLADAYIVTKTSSAANGVNYIYKIDIATGGKTLVRRGDPGQISLGQLRKMAGVSSEMEVENTLYNNVVPYSVIYPNAVLFENVEISEQEVTKNKVTPLVNPTQRAAVATASGYGRSE